MVAKVAIIVYNYASTKIIIFIMQYRLLIVAVLLGAVLILDRCSREEKDCGLLEGTSCSLFSQKGDDNVVRYGMKDANFAFKTPAKYDSVPRKVGEYIVAYCGGGLDIYAMPDFVEILPDVKKQNFDSLKTLYVVSDASYQKYLVFGADNVAGPYSTVEILSYDGQDFIYAKNDSSVVLYDVSSGAALVPDGTQEIVFVTDTLDTRVEKYLWIKSDNLNWVKFARGEILDTVDVALVDSLRLSDGFKGLSRDVYKINKRN